MEENQTNQEEIERDFAENGVPGLVAFTRPFRFVLRDDKDEWDVNVEDLNNNKYDYVKLHQISASIDVGLPAGLHMYIGFDGSLILPAIHELFHPHERAVEAFNRILAQLLLGGVYYEAIDPVDVVSARVYESKYFRPLGGEDSYMGRIQNALKNRVADPFSRADLINPKTITWHQLYIAMKNGKAISEKINTVSLMLIVRGVSFFIAQNWTESLINFWVASEQAVSILWETHIIKGGRSSTLSKKERRGFLEDYRTWTSSAQIEMLFQIEIIQEQTHAKLNIARKARNNFAHNGKIPTREAAEASFDALFHLISQICFSRSDEFETMISGYKSYDRHSDRDKQRKSGSFPLSDFEGIMVGPYPPLPIDPYWGEEGRDTQVPKIYLLRRDDHDELDSLVPTEESE